MEENMKPGPRNLITDISGLRVGHAIDAQIRTGCSVLLAQAPFVAGVHVMGGAPGTRETDLLAPDKLVQQVDALVLSGGSAFGLDAASGVADGLRAKGRGFPAGDQRIPIVPAAILFDLLNGGDKSWRSNPYSALGAKALDAAMQSFDLGSAGAGYGASTADLKGGLGSASLVLPNGITVGAMVAVNALGSAVSGAQGEFWAAPWEVGDEFGGRGTAFPKNALTAPKVKNADGATTIAIVATDASLTQAECTRMAIAAHDGMARSLVPSHTPMDGDLVFAASTGAREKTDDSDPLLIGHAASVCLSRAIARGVFEATAIDGDSLPTWSEVFGQSRG